ncbi:MAG: succinate dehydrogenase [Chlamydiales bacterium]|nr:succinate dehydrogenase [Chlamydiales bacterium]
MSVDTTIKLPRAFIWRRLHSLMGLWLVLFLMEHLLVNSQAALLLGDNGRGFVEMVNGIHNLPYLSFIEFTLLGVPIAIHLIWGVKYLFTAKPNAHKTDGSTPSLPEYGRNRAYSWQRITSWILLFMLVAHVVKFRFIDYPASLNIGGDVAYFAPVKVDNGLYTVADRLKVALFDKEAIEIEKRSLKDRSDEEALFEAADSLKKNEILTWDGPASVKYDSQREVIFTSAQKFQDKINWVKMLGSYSLADDEVLAVSDNFGTASLLLVRDTFKSPIYVFLYTIFVLSACFHGFNGLWTFLITWGVVLRMSAQKSTATFAIGLMLLVAFLGLASIWGTYWLNLRY